MALVGQSGSGKSTLADLLPRFYDVASGAVKIGGKDIRQLKVHELRSLMGNVNQEAILFNDTFYNNITFGVENATMEQVIEAAKSLTLTSLSWHRNKGMIRQSATAVVASPVVSVNASQSLALYSKILLSSSSMRPLQRSIVKANTLCSKRLND